MRHVIISNWTGGSFDVVVAVTVAANAGPPEICAQAVEAERIVATLANTREISGSVV